MGTAGFGHTLYMGLGEETTYGTVVTRDRFLDINSESLALSHERITSGSINQIGTRKERVNNGLFRVAGDVTLDLPYRDAELLLKHTLGSVSTTGPVSGAYTHTFSIADALPTGLTVEIFRDSSGFLGTDLNAAFIYEGCKINSLALSASVGSYLSAVVSFVSEDENRLAKSGAAVATDLNTTRDLMTFTQGTLSYDGFTTQVENIDLTINNNLNADRFRLGSRITREPVRGGKIEISGSFVADFDGFARYNEFRASSTRALILTFTGGNIPNSATAQSLTITLPFVLPTGTDLNVDDGGILTQTIPFMAYRDPSVASPNGQELKAVLVNAKSAIP